MNALQLVALVTNRQQSAALDTYNNLMLNKINDRIEEIKPDVAQAYFSPAFGEEE